MKEPEHNCELIDELQKEISQLWIDNSHIDGFETEGKHWDTIMAVLLKLDVLRARIEKLRKWGRLNNFFKNRINEN